MPSGNLFHREWRLRAIIKMGWTRKFVLGIIYHRQSLVGDFMLYPHAYGQRWTLDIMNDTLNVEFVKFQNISYSGSAIANIISHKAIRIAFIDMHKIYSESEQPSTNFFRIRGQSLQTYMKWLEVKIRNHKSRFVYIFHSSRDLLQATWHFTFRKLFYSKSSLDNGIHEDQCIESLLISNMCSDGLLLTVEVRIYPNKNIFDWKLDTVNERSVQPFLW